MRIPSANPQAIACVRGGMGAPKLRGTVRFYAIPGGTLVTAEVSGLPENDTGFFAFHIHEAAVAAARTFRIPEDIITRTPGASPSRGRLAAAAQHGRAGVSRGGDGQIHALRGGWADGGHSRKRGRFSHPTGGKRGQKNRLRRDTAGVMRGFSENKEDYDEKLPFARFLWL